MIKELQDLVWSILPKEFKEEVKEIYSNAITYHPCGYNHKTDLLKYLFGHHNLTSDVDEESKSSEPKFKEGDTVRHKGQNHEIGKIVKYWVKKTLEI